jgi:PAS domain-containing protein
MSAANRRLRCRGDRLPQQTPKSDGALAELYQRHRNLENINHTHAAVAEPSDDAIVSKDLDGIIATFTEGAERLYGYKAEEVLGKPMTIPIPADR